MALNSQVHIYSVDSKAFYTDVELAIDKEMQPLYKRKNEIKSIKQEDRDEDLKLEYKTLNKEISAKKEVLKKEIELSKAVRDMNPLCLVDRNVVSVFESSLTRACKLKTGKIYTDLVIVRTFYYGILEDIIRDGFYLNGEKYILFSASAGQIRTKKSVFIKESLWNTVAKTVTCDLSVEHINSNGGINTNKYLAYLALAGSATDIWEGFDIDKTIVVDDFATTFETIVDFIDRDTFEIEKNKTMPITIEHMDGCGIMLPKVSRKSFMCRLPFVKGLLVPFQYNSFAKINGENYKIKDIYGKEYDIIEDDIQVIFTKSQFKMSKYYKDWDDYKTKFKENNCDAGICNIEEDFINDAKINYQMLQTLTDITDDELHQLAQPLNDDIVNISSDRKTMMKILGVTEFNKNKDHVQQSIEIYPELLQDEHCKESLRDLKKKLVNDGRHARLPINGKYTFLVPDLYAFCEWLFLGAENPKGLLKNGEVSCKLYPKDVELDVLRSPHLYLEHCIRENKREDDIKRWFISNSIYTSIHDPITRILQNDVDGDKALVVFDNLLISIAKRNIKKWGVVPLYYEMAKAEATPLSNDAMYQGMINAYSGGNIGEVSNNISKCWNSDIVDEETVDVIKYLCMQNNFVIDFAKTMFKVEPPKEIRVMIAERTKNKLPHFFTYAKEKNADQVMTPNNSTVNRLNWIVKDLRFNFKKAQLGKFDFRMLMNDDRIVIDNSVIEKYEIVKKKVMRHDFVEGYDSGNHNYIWECVRDEMLESNCDINYVVDNLVLYLFGNKNKRKKILWNCFGDIIVSNLKNNITEGLDNGWIMCEKCGIRVCCTGTTHKYCTPCAKKIQDERIKDNNKNRSVEKSL